MIKKSIMLFFCKYRKLKTLKYLIFLRKALAISIICDECGSKDERIFHEEESTETSWFNW